MEYKIKRKLIDGNPNNISRSILIEKDGNSVELSFDEVELLFDAMLEFRDEEYLEAI